MPLLAPRGAAFVPFMCLGSPGAVQIAAFRTQMLAGGMQVPLLGADIAARIAHIAAFLHHIAVESMGPGACRSRGAAVGMVVRMGLGKGRGERNQRGGQQKLAHGILLQTRSHPCDHGRNLHR